MTFAPHLVQPFERAAPIFRSTLDLHELPENKSNPRPIVQLIIALQNQVQRTDCEKRLPGAAPSQYLLTTHMLEELLISATWFNLDLAGEYPIKSFKAG